MVLIASFSSSERVGSVKAIRNAGSPLWAKICLAIAKLFCAEGAVSLGTVISNSLRPNGTPTSGTFPNCPVISNLARLNSAKLNFSNDADSSSNARDPGSKFLSLSVCLIKLSFSFLCDLDNASCFSSLLIRSLSACSSFLTTPRSALSALLSSALALTSN